MPQGQQHHLLPAPIHLQQCTHNNPWRNRENPCISYFTFIRKGYLMSKITTRSGLGSSGAAKCHTLQLRAQQRGPQFPGQGEQRSFPQAAASLHALPTARRQRHQPGHLMRGVTGVPIISAITSLPAPFMAFYCPAGTKTRKWNGNIWNTRYGCC